MEDEDTDWWTARNQKNAALSACVKKKLTISEVTCQGQCDLKNG